MGSSDANSAALNDRWTAVLERDTTAVGRFVYAVRSTGVFCHPNCPSRRPNRSNVRFFDSASEAESAGYRACKRCRPNQTPSFDPVAKQLTLACRFIEEAENGPSLSEIASHVGLSPFYLHRTFRNRLGVTPKQYTSARRALRLKMQLALGERVADAIYAAGYGACGRCYAQAAEILGMTPKQYRNHGEGRDIRFATASCVLGRVLVAVTKKGICHIALGNDDSTLAVELLARLPAARQVARDKELQELLTAVVSLIESPAKDVAFPLDIRGTAFQQKVWLALRAIPPGQTLTYAKLAVAIGRPEAVRAVASACAANTLAIAVPCHRIVRSDGKLGGYRWGGGRKKALLERERNRSSD
jgi:AraC family transcriptional regulator of adaptative response/methylated-DNA-[protein]-cysteine methyltransferase